MIALSFSGAYMYTRQAGLLPGNPSFTVSHIWAGLPDCSLSVVLYILKLLMQAHSPLLLVSFLLSRVNVVKS